MLALGKQVVLYPRQDVYVEKQRPTWSYRTSILQVGKTDSPDSEYRAFLAFDLTTLAASHARDVSIHSMRARAACTQLPPCIFSCLTTAAVILCLNTCRQNFSPCHSPLTARC